MKYKITVAYDGTDFFGWQEQPKDITISSVLKKTFCDVFGGPIKLIGASRTDTGVHALGQVAMITTDLNLNPKTMGYAWNNHLPKSIIIRSVEHAPDNFHPCCNVRQKTYYYHLFLRQPLPMFARYGWFYHVIEKVDLEKFKSALNLYVGTHNFSSFCKLSPDEDKTPVRTIDSITVEKISHLNSLRIIIKGRSFLRFQIRRMVGYALDVAHRPNLSLKYLQGMLDNPNSQQTLLKADASGLCLRKVVYDHDITTCK